MITVAYLDNSVRQYATREARKRWERRHPKSIPVDSWVGQMPDNSASAQEWDAFRARNGYAGGR